MKQRSVNCVTVEVGIVVEAATPVVLRTLYASAINDACRWDVSGVGRALTLARSELSPIEFERLQDDLDIGTAARGLMPSKRSVR